MKTRRKFATSPGPDILVAKGKNVWVTISSPAVNVRLLAFTATLILKNADSEVQLTK